MEIKLKLLETIHQQDEIIKQKNEVISKLANENIEQENFINSIMKEATE